MMDDRDRSGGENNAAAEGWWRPGTAGTGRRSHSSGAIQPSQSVFRSERRHHQHASSSRQSGSHSLEPSSSHRVRSAQPPATGSSPQLVEVVRLENPRPGILRVANDYVAVPAASLADNKTVFPDDPRNFFCPPSTSRWSDPRNFDRPKVHLQPATKTLHSSKKTAISENSVQNANSGIGEIRPLVRCAEIPPPLPFRPVLQSAEKLDRQTVVRSQPLPSSQVELPRKASLPGSGRKGVGALSVTASLPLLATNGVSGAVSTMTSAPTVVGRDVICGQCGRCRCAACTRPRPLPSVWICDDTCLCSAETLVDALSCMCCVRGALYHTEGTPPLSDQELFSCDGERAGGRWACLAAAALLLPCLWCYLPLKGCAGVVAACYARYHHSGCRCIRQLPNLEQRLPAVPQKHSSAATLNRANSYAPDHAHFDSKSSVV